MTESEFKRDLLSTKSLWTVHRVEAWSIQVFASVGELPCWETAQRPKMSFSQWKVKTDDIVSFWRFRISRWNFNFCFLPKRFFKFFLLLQLKNFQSSVICFFPLSLSLPLSLSKGIFDLHVLFFLNGSLEFKRTLQGFQRPTWFLTWTSRNCFCTFQAPKATRRVFDLGP